MHQTPTGIGLGLRASLLSAVEQGEADGKVAFLEISPENHMHRAGRYAERFTEVARKFPIITHGLAMSLGGVDPFDASYMTELRGFTDRFGGAWHSDHLCFCGVGGQALHDLLPIPFNEATARRVAARIVEAQDRLGKPMLVENISYYLELGASEFDEPEFITQVLERADCGLLLDVNNIYVNAKNHGVDPEAWLSRVPLARVRQLHVAGHERWDETMWIDTHGAPVEDRVYALMAKVVEETGPIPVLLERDRNIPPLAELLAEVAALDRVYQGALARWRARAEAEA
ncbi:MAG: DUF692 domain-containing protein [Nannocystaceae bacterium]|nr:DUF692 domain-containing protein [Myxococcales bacterium]